MNVLKLEGGRKGINTNCLAPGARTRMTESLPAQSGGSPHQVSPAVLYLSSDEAPNGIILQASGGHFSVLRMSHGESVNLGEGVSYESFLEKAESIVNGKIIS